MIHEIFSAFIHSKAKEVAETKKPVSKVTGIFRGGVQLEDYSKADQERLKNGERPRGVPTHNDI